MPDARSLDTLHASEKCAFVIQDLGILLRSYPIVTIEEIPKIQNGFTWTITRRCITKETEGRNIAR